MSYTERFTPSRENLRNPERLPSTNLRFAEYVPSTILTNDHIVGWNIPTRNGTLTAEEIKSRTGVERRFIADPEETQLTMATMALDRLGLRPSQIDALFVSTSHATLINLAQSLRDEFGMSSRTQVMDVHAACSGTVRALGEIKENEAEFQGKNVVLLASELYSRSLVDLSKPDGITKDPSLAQTLFTDGAVAMSGIYGQDFRVLAAQHKYLGEEYRDLIRMPQQTGFTQPAIVEPVPQSETGRFIQNGNGVYKLVRRLIPPMVRQLVSDSGLTPEDIQLIIPHQGSGRMVEGLAQDFEADFAGKTMADYRDGNLSSGSVLRAMKRAFGNGQLQFGQNVVLQQFGAGMFAAGAVVNFPRVA